MSRIEGSPPQFTRMQPAANGTERQEGTPIRAGDRVQVAAFTPSQALESGTTAAVSALKAAGVDAGRLDPLQLRGLGGLVGKGLIKPAALAELATAVAADPAVLGRMLSTHRKAYLDQVSREQGLRMEDGTAQWTVQEIANMEWVLAQLPERFKAIVRQGPPLTKEKASDSVTGLYNPFNNRITYYENFNRGGRTLEEIKRSEGPMRGTMIMEMAHAWQIRQSSPLNPGVGGILKGLRDIVYPAQDIISEWSKFSGWTVAPKWSPWSWFGRQTPNASNASQALKNLEFKLLGRNFKFDFTDLRFDPAKAETLVSAYAKTDPYEDFGESLEAYLLDPEVLKRRSPEKYAYLRDKVMEGREVDYRFGVFR